MISSLAGSLNHSKSAAERDFPSSASDGLASVTSADNIFPYSTKLEVTTTGAIPAARHSHSATVGPDDYLITIYGGQGETTNMFGDIVVLDARTFIWSAPTISGTVPAPLIKHSTVQVGDAMIVMGGGIDFDLTAPSSITSETIVLNTTTWSWLTTYTIPKRHCLRQPAIRGCDHDSDHHHNLNCLRRPQREHHRGRHRRYLLLWRRKRRLAASLVKKDSEEAKRIGD
ncbi:hypothetical protein BC938DRAFT_479545 [Jimgerdemannia flammicorona]|uniref:Uncharacterized protein n=1 Tax=Jimgerdemannia flammicorona TaxID=994334 RepID=A0A433QXU0_9FUNG|nr:hypothetical protein BC938DRAFT_479545 [Jimgerdemannia flammicorona]